jgi:anaerobic selenocysteine-containing dehydrogenase
MARKELDLPAVLSHIADGVHYTTCTHDCPDACNFKLIVRDGRIVQLRGNPDHGYTRGNLCGKTPAEIFTSFHNSDGRLRHPLYRKGCRFGRISWDEAFGIVCERMKGCLHEYGPLSILYCHGAGTFGGLLRVVNRRFFSLLGGASMLCGSICDSAGIVAQSLDFGDQRTHSPEDILNSGFVLIWGKNPANTSPHFMANLRLLKERGIDVILIDPIKTQTVQACTEYYRIQPNTDGLLALAMARMIIENGWIDHDFLLRHTIGYEDFQRIARKVNVSEVAAACGMRIEEIESIATRYGRIKPSSIWLGFGLQRYVNGGEVFRYIDALGAITGNIGKSGGGVSHQSSEVQKYIDYSLNLEHAIVKKRFIRKGALPEDIEKAQNPPIKMIVVSALNPVAQCPNSGRVREVLQKTDFVVVIESVMSDTAQCADLILPTTRMLEEDEVMWAYGTHYIGLSPRILPAPYETKSNFEIFQELAKRLGFGEEIAGDSREWINRILGPVSGFGISYDSLLEGPQPLNPNLQAVAFEDLRFTTPSGRFDFIRRAETVSEMMQHRSHRHPAAGNGFPFTFLTVHHHAWLNSNMYSEKQKALLGSPPNVFVHPSTAGALGVSEGEIVYVCSRIGEMKATVRISEHYHPSAVTMYQGGSVSDLTCANLITDDSLISNIGDMSAFYSTRVNIKRTV